MSECPIDFVTLFEIKHEKKEFDERYKALEKCLTPFDTIIEIKNNSKSHSLTYYISLHKAEEESEIHLDIQEEIKSSNLKESPITNYRTKLSYQLQLCKLTPSKVNGKITLKRLLEISDNVVNNAEEDFNTSITSLEYKNI